MLDIKKLHEGKYADFMLQVQSRLDEMAIEEYETEKMIVGLNMFKESDQLDELSNKTLGNYVKKAADRMVRHDNMMDIVSPKSDAFNNHNRKFNNRRKGLNKAADKLGRN